MPVYSLYFSQGPDESTLLATGKVMYQRSCMELIMIELFKSLNDVAGIMAIFFFLLQSFESCVCKFDGGCGMANNL